MKELIIAAAVILLNVIVSFATDGQWKTAGLGLVTVLSGSTGKEYAAE